MRMRASAIGLVLVAATVGCGESDPSESGTASPTLGTGGVASVLAPQESVASTAPGGKVTPTTAAHTADSSNDPAPDEPLWLAPTSSPRGLRLVGATLGLVPGCGPEDNCEVLAPGARLVYDTDDLAVARSAQVTQSIPDPRSVDPATFGDLERRIGGRDVTMRDFGDDSVVAELTWTEPNGIVVTIGTLGLTADDLDALVASFQPTEPDQWPASEVLEPLRRCVDETTRYAPTLIPEGWNRVVLDAQPTGTCDVDSFLWMSLVEPGTMVNLTVAPSTRASEQPGDTIMINGRPAVLDTVEDSNGMPQSSIDMRIGPVTVSAHGNVTPEVLGEIMSSVGPIGETEWSQLVDEIATEP